LVVLVVALQSGLAVEGDHDFWVYVIQHLLLMNFVPVLLALSAPVTLALQASGRPTQRALLAVLHHPVVEFLTHPLVVAAAVYVTMLVYFLSPFYNLALEHSWLRDLVFLHFLVSGYLFWWILIGRDPSRWRLSHPAKLGLLAPGIAVNAILGVSLTGATASVAPHFQTLGDTHVGGSILWVVGELISLVAMGLVLYQWMQFEEREAVRADRRTDAEEGRAADPRPGQRGATASPAHNGRTGSSTDP
jgi:putative copper resistance protein D